MAAPFCFNHSRYPKWDGLPISTMYGGLALYLDPALGHPILRRFFRRVRLVRHFFRSTRLRNAVACTRRLFNVFVKCRSSKDHRSRQTQ